MDNEKVIEININLTHELAAAAVVVLFGFVLASYLLFGQGEAAASDGQEAAADSFGLRQYYITRGTYDGADADEACANGYHFASLWEILDPSNLRYNSSLGLLQKDNGSGPPTIVEGWVRTGYDSGAGASSPGIENCDVWESNSSSDNGTLAGLVGEWAAGYEELNVWDVAVTHCGESEHVHVWCVED